MTVTTEPSVPGETPAPVAPAVPAPVTLTAEQFAALMAAVTPAPGVVATVETKVSTAASDLVTELETLVASAKAKIEADAATVSAGASGAATATESYVETNWLPLLALAAGLAALAIELVPAFLKW